MFGRFNGIVFATLLFISSFLGSIFILFPFIPLAYFFPKLWRICADRFVGYWIIFPSSMLFFIFNVKFRVTGDKIINDKPAIIIMNHRTRLDWLFFWNALYKMDPWLLTSEKISLKSSLKKIPGAGWAMSCSAYIFLNRNFEHDQKHLKKMLKYYADSSRNYQLLFFPEGTDLGNHAVQISNNFADKNKLPRYEYILHPRTTGFNYILNIMKQNNYIDYVYDVSVGYSDQIISNEIDLLRNGKFPKIVHFDIKKYDINKLLDEHNKLNKDILSTVNKNTNDDQSLILNNYNFSFWLNEIWKKKEEKLRLFYSETDVLKRQFQPSGAGHVWPLTTKGFAYYIAFGFWIFFSIFWIYYLITNKIVFCFSLIVSIFYIWVVQKKGGMELLVMEWFYKKKIS